MKKGWIKKRLCGICALLLTFVLMTTSVFAAGLDSFTDAKTHWAAGVLERAVNDGVLNGSGSRLNPDGTLTGAEMAAILVRRTDAQRWSRAYPGTSSSDWYYMVCAVAMEGGILPENGSISPKSPVTRAQVFLSFARAFGCDTEKADTSVLKGFSDGSSLSGEQAAAAAALIEAGIVTGNDQGMLEPGKNVTRAEFVTMLYRAGSPGETDGMKIILKAGNIAAGDSLKASASFSGIEEPVVCDMQWYLDGSAVPGYHSSGKQLNAGSASALTQPLKFSRNMALSHRIGLGVDYTDAATGEKIRIYTEKTVRVTNYSSAYYDRQENKALYAKALAVVSPTYKGNYTSSYNIDYSAAIKQAFVSGKGYSSKTGYLIWTNLGTQKVNIFTGSKGNWKLLKTFRCATGARSTPTPKGVTYVTYKQTGWYTSSYICKPVVRFYPGTGYAFHSRLYYPDGSGRVKDGAMGYPVSHGCVRMEDEGIRWIYNNIPLNTTVVIY